MADTSDLKSAVRKGVPVQVRPRAPVTTSGSQCRKTLKPTAPRGAPGVPSGIPYFITKEDAYAKNNCFITVPDMYIWICLL